MALMKDRDLPKPVCPKCGWEDFSLSAAADGRPKFTCMMCKHVWTKGLDGGYYSVYAKPIRS